MTISVSILACFKILWNLLFHYMLSSFFHLWYSSVFNYIPPTFPGLFLQLWDNFEDIILYLLDTVTLAYLYRLQLRTDVQPVCMHNLNAKKQFEEIVSNNCIGICLWNKSVVRTRRFVRTWRLWTRRFYHSLCGSPSIRRKKSDVPGCYTV